MLSLLLMMSLGAEPAGGADQRAAYLEEIRDMLPRSPAWEEWLEKTGELPPDFAAMPSFAPIPDPLTWREDGALKRISGPDEWPAQRERLLAEFKQWILGTVPPPPGNLEAEVLVERQEYGATVREVELRFGPGKAAKLWVEVFIPPGDGPFPVFMTQANHRGWALIALRRGYLCCVYAGADARDDTDTFIEPYAEYDWSKLVRRGWAAGRVIDYLEGVPQADTRRVALKGHSRNGKTSLMASALDERIAVVISSSSGVGGCMASRYCGEHHFAEGIEHITRNFTDWFHPRWRFFAGREHKAPVDLNQLVALSAPRACLLSIAFNDSVEGAWAMEKTYLSAKPVYEMLGVPGRLATLWRPAGHETWTTVIERYVDWCDVQFGRGDRSFPETLHYPHDWEGWRARHAGEFDVTAYPERPFADAPPAAANLDTCEGRREAVRAAVDEMLGAAPPGAEGPRHDYGEESDHTEEKLKRFEAGARLTKDDLMFGEYINAPVYMPEGTMESGARIPGVLWLHAWCNPSGYAPAYKRGAPPYEFIAREGFAVFCYDQAGCGRRVDEVDRFYERHPGWSLMGKMVRDARAALKVMSELPYVDPKRIYVMGYSLGAHVALHLAAVDESPAGYALVCAPPPYRLDTDYAETGGIERWAQVRMWVPRLGLFAGNENRVPYDVDELLGMMAPRPVLLLTPRLDRCAPLPLMNRAVAAARTVYRCYGAEQALTQETPDTYNHFDTENQRIVAQWLDRTAR